MDIGAIDRSATSGGSWLHGVSPSAMLVAFALVLGAVVVTWNLLIVATLVLLLVAAVLSARVDLKLAFGLALYPAIFALIFALASAPGPMAAAVITLKAVTAALAAVLVVLTTPYPQVFAPVQRIVPGIVGDSLLMTYRTLFLLLEKFSHLTRAVRIRSGWNAGRSPLRAASLAASALGGTVLYAVDLAQRDYDVMRVRGYSGRLRAPSPKSADPRIDAVLIAAAVIAFGTSVLWRIGWQTLNPYSWLPMIPALAIVAVALLMRRRTAHA